jgi:hypothetical protein
VPGSEFISERVPGSEFISEQENRAENPMKFPWFCGGATLQALSFT